LRNVECEVTGNVGERRNIVHSQSILEDRKSLN
jgi:hypothetical protein